MDTYDIRRENLRAIVAERFAGNQSACAEAIDCKPPQLNRWLSTTASDPRRITEQSARQIEKALRLDPMALDKALFEVREPTPTYLAEPGSRRNTPAHIDIDTAHKLLRGVLESIGIDVDQALISIDANGINIKANWIGQAQQNHDSKPVRPKIKPITVNINATPRLKQNS